MWLDLFGDLTKKKSKNGLLVIILVAISFQVSLLLIAYSMIFMKMCYVFSGRYIVIGVTLCLCF